MPFMTHVFDVTFHRQPAPGAPFKWDISETVQVTAMDQQSAERLARRSLGLDEQWRLRSAQDRGTWKKFYAQQEA